MNATESARPSHIRQNPPACMNFNKAKESSKSKVLKVALHINENRLVSSFVRAKNIIVAAVSKALKAIIDLINTVVQFFVKIVKSLLPDHINSANDNDVIGVSKSLVLTDLSKEFLDETFDKIEKHGLNAPEISKEIKSLAEDPGFWRIWANQLAIPYAAQQNPKDQVLQLLTFFKIDPITRRATILKNIESVEKALPIYPLTAYLISPQLGTTLFDLYCKKPCGTYFAYPNIDSNFASSEAYVIANGITSDDRYMVLTLNNRSNVLKN